MLLQGMLMDNRDIHIKILAQTVYELRLLLSNHLGSHDPSMKYEAIAAHLAHAVHNEALAIIENRQDEFDSDDFIPENYLKELEKYNVKIELE